MTENEFVFRPNVLPDGRWLPVSWVFGAEAPAQNAITDDDIVRIAEDYDVPPSRLKAVQEVESSGSGFLLNEPHPARPKILFEAHWFYRLTPKPVSRVRPDLASHHWDRSLYKGGSAEWDRLRDAYDFDPMQALKSASYGLGQVMGMNYRDAGDQSIQQFIIEAFTGEAAQFRQMVEFCKHHDLLHDLREGYWARFARGYNGKSYLKNHYDIKLAAAAEKAKSRFA